MRGALLQLAVAAHVGVVALLPSSPKKDKNPKQAPRRAKSDKKDGEKQQ